MNQVRFHQLEIDLMINLSYFKIESNPRLICLVYYSNQLGV